VRETSQAPKSQRSWIEQSIVEELEKAAKSRPGSNESIRDDDRVTTIASLPGGFIGFLWASVSLRTELLTLCVGSD
jgi:hypothetical protein